VPRRVIEGFTGDLPIRLPAVVAVAVLVLAVLGCDGGHRGADLSVRIVSGYGSAGKDQRLSLRCDPTGGELPNRAAVCQMIAKHRQAMLFPGRMRSTCVGGVNVPPTVSVSGTSRGRSVRFSARVMCEWPGGVAALAYWAAADLPHNLPLASVRLACGEDPLLQKAPISWARVRTCLGTVPPHWHPSKN
jgi:hypothetical protein